MYTGAKMRVAEVALRGVAVRLKQCDLRRFSWDMAHWEGSRETRKGVPLAAYW